MHRRGDSGKSDAGQATQRENAGDRAAPAARSALARMKLMANATLKADSMRMFSAARRLVSGSNPKIAAIGPAKPTPTTVTMSPKDISIMGVVAWLAGDKMTATVTQIQEGF